MVLEMLRYLIKGFKDCLTLDDGFIER